MLLLLLACSPDVTPDTADTVDTADTTTVPQDTAPDTIPEDTAPPKDTAPLIDALCINELMPDNEAALLDADGGSPDWIELHNPTAEAVSLAGWWITDDADDYYQHALSDDLTLKPGAFLLLYADNDPNAGSDHLGFALSADGGAVGLFAPDDSGQIIQYGSVSEDFSVAREDDCCVSSDCLIFDFRGTPGTTNNPPVPIVEEVFPLGSAWRYLDTDLAPDATWTLADFDDSGWLEGAGPLGFGDHHQLTTTESGPDGDRTLTTYFRRTFTLDASAVGLQLELMRDDGALIWLNGEEALRSNLPEGVIGHDTLASDAIGSPDEDAVVVHSVDETLLVEGLNVFAVEVHQAENISSDLTFDLGVIVEVLQSE
ncbi:MAG: hypothetical protein ACI8RZ_003600 [Myxococcota bacterium]|jgi:hypothetical protein